MDHHQKQARLVLRPYLSSDKRPNVADTEILKKLCKQLRATEATNNKSIGVFNFWIDHLTESLFNLNVLTEYKEFEKVSIELGNFNQVNDNLKRANAVITKLIKQTKSVLSRAGGTKTKGSKK